MNGYEFAGQAVLKFREEYASKHSGYYPDEFLVILCTMYNSDKILYRHTEYVCVNSADDCEWENDWWEGEETVIVDTIVPFEEIQNLVDNKKQADTRINKLENMVADLIKTINTQTALMKPVIFVAEDEDKVAKIKKFLNENTLDI